MRNFIYSLLLATMFLSAGAMNNARACSNDPCIYQAPQVIVKKVYVYVTHKPAIIHHAATRPHHLVVASNPECMFVPFPRGKASQPVLFFQYKEDAHCQNKKTFCTECTDWIHGERGDVYGPAAGMLGGNSVAYAVPAGKGAFVPRNHRGRVAYCDQASPDNSPSSSWHFVD